MNKLMNLVVCTALVAVSIYVIMFIPTVIDFSQVVIRLEDNETIYQFLIYIPLIISIFNAVLVLFNVFLENIALTFMNLIISIATSVFIMMNVMGSVQALAKIGEKLSLVSYVNIATSVILIAIIVLHFVRNKKHEETKVESTPAPAN